MPCPIIGAELRIMDHWMDFVNFLFYLFFFETGRFWAPTNFEKEFPFLFLFLFFLFFYRLARREEKEEEEAEYLLRAKAAR